MGNNLKIFGRFLDQPILIAKLNKNMPKILGSGVLLYSVKKGYDTFQAAKLLPEEEKKCIKKSFLKDSFILSMSVASALLAPKIASKITNRAMIDSLKNVKENNKKLIDEFLSINKNNLPKNVCKILERAKTEVLSLCDVKSLYNDLKLDSRDKFINKLIPEPANISCKDILSEIGYLSVYGAVPVLGGITSGILADKVLGDNLKDTAPDKISEGVYQYLANIFMCNVGAAAALGCIEKMGIKSKVARALGMITGIVLTGVVGGSKIANTFTKKILDPITQHKSKERKPELIDLGMHTDDVATVAVLSGLKWIEPSLPFLYAISGYKSGIGYRN